jgi:hypothetical protein
VTFCWEVKLQKQIVQLLHWTFIKSLNLLDLNEFLLGKLANVIVSILSALIKVIKKFKIKRSEISVEIEDLTRSRKYVNSSGPKTLNLGANGDASRDARLEEESLCILDM